MKKSLLYISIFALGFQSCKDDNKTPNYVEPEDINVQNSYDDQSIQKYMSTHYLDDRGKITAFDNNDSSDDNELSLASLNPVTLPSGAIYIVRNGAQPTNGTTIGGTDILRFMSTATTHLAANTDGNIAFISPTVFRSTIDGSGVPEVDPNYFYTPQSVIDNFNTTNSTAYGKDFFEIEGLREALTKYKAFDIPDSDAYNLQGVIIVPSRAAFARDPHFQYSGISLRNRTLIFNFQVYKTSPRN